MIFTSLYKKHESLGAKLVDFNGYMMPLNYKNGIVSEVVSIRKDVGMFDVSHMGRIVLEGTDAKKILSKFLCANLDNLDIGKSRYTIFLNNECQIVDDLIVSNMTSNTFLLVVNASNRNSIVNIISSSIEHGTDINFRDDTNHTSMIALQGPRSSEILPVIKTIEKYEIKKTFIDKYEVIISTTGYTGEDGCEIICSNENVANIWEFLCDKKVNPCGLGARDVLRLEVSLPLYGNELNLETNPFEVNLGRLIDFSNKNLLSYKKLYSLSKKESQKKLVSFKMTSRGIPRKDYKIYNGEKTIGFVTSGTFSSNLGLGIGLAFISDGDTKIGRKISIDIRGKMQGAEIAKRRFV
ncbi:MAG: glycine cleavage system aminomethyltransferase GcvT [Dehalococcoidia bacterium]